MNLLDRLPGRIYLILATLIFAASSSVTRQIINLGEQHLINGRNPISFCNVLLVGNIWALIILTLLYRQEIQTHPWKKLKSKDWVFLSLIALLSGALGPALIFWALDQTSVSNVILIGRIEPPLTLALSVLFLKERVNLWVIAGAILGFIGVGLTVLIAPASDSMVDMATFEIGVGELLVIAGAVATAIATIISKITLQHISLGFFSLYRTTLGTLIFFTIVVKLFGWSHFTDVFAPVIWQWMLIYSAIIVVGGQFFWLKGLKLSNASEVSLVNAFSPLAAIVFAYLIVREVPTLGQYIGGSVIAIAIIINQIGLNRLSPPPSPKPLSASGLDRSVGFKGM
ncbi:MULTISPECIES: DMT family transporter [unclassified Roseofilum]|uniref:DMT family transporter n=1 Tax=unclassified Roseofilum TaxID=2620099 RepID=UPI001B2B8330|nr:MULTISPECIES: DMT family transporter [unclassified Roseofilum]MBP0007930.1 DMT family transporter [Roseofilum sp. Belize Diploria]MBP0032337.1 DMT family transporter [Roseofilum sp. Belize BBD 4]